MSREEAIKELTELLPEEFLSEYTDAIKMGIETLNQEPCGDYISREAVMHILDEVGGDFDNPREAVVPIDYIADMVSELPSVIPQPKMGKWKAFTHSAYHGNDEDGEPIWREVTVYHCNLCNRRTVIKEKYCPNCGAKMREVEDDQRRYR